MHQSSFSIQGGSKHLILIILIIHIIVVEYRLRKMRRMSTSEIIKKDEYRVRWMSKYMMRRMRMIRRMEEWDGLERLVGWEGWQH